MLGAKRTEQIKVVANRPHQKGQSLLIVVMGLLVTGLVILASSSLFIFQDKATQKARVLGETKDLERFLYSNLDCSRTVGAIMPAGCDTPSGVFLTVTSFPTATAPTGRPLVNLPANVTKQHGQTLASVAITSLNAVTSVTEFSSFGRNIEVRARCLRPSGTPKSTFVIEFRRKKERNSEWRDLFGGMNVCTVPP